MKKQLLFLFALVSGAMFFVQQASAQVDVTASGGTAFASYTTLNLAFAAINAGTHTGTIAIGISANTTETLSAVLNASGSGSASYTSISIQPTGGSARTITGAIVGHLVDLNGADNVTIDGLNTGGNSLTISNTGTGAASTIRFIADATNNIVQNCTLLGSTTSYGVVYFSTGTTTGNDNNNINHCNVGPAGANNPLNGIYSLGTSAAIDNATITISTNNIYDYFVTGSATNGMNINTGSSAWTITNNRLYQTANRSYISANTHTGINITVGSGYTITGNVIGYANSSGTGTTNMMGITGSLGGTFPSAYTTGGTANATRYIGINCAFTAAGTASEIQNNTIAGFAIYTSSGAATANGIWCGIDVTSGNANIGTSTGNTIGATSGNSSVYTANTASGGTIVGIYATSSNTVTIQNNTMGALDAMGASASTCGGITGINTAGTGTFNVSGNTIGNSSTPSLRMGNLTTGTNLSNVGTTFGTATGIGMFQGILNSASGTVTIGTLALPNIIRNATLNTSSSTAATAVYRGISTSAGTTTVSYNSIYNISAAITNTAINANLGALGICLSGGTNPVISNNTIYNLSLTNTGTGGYNLSGIFYTLPTTSITISKNKIYALSNASTSVTATTPGTATGIFIRDGNGATNTISNNMISLGNGQTTNTTFMGIWCQYVSSTATTLKIYYNSINIEGTVSSGAMPSFGILRGDLSTTANTVYTMDVRNNIFTNTRSGGTGKHYAIANSYGATASATGWGTNASNYNVLNGTAANIGYWTADKTFSTWKTASASDANSLSGITVTFVATATGDLHLNMGTTPTQMESGGAVLSVTDDFDSQTRPGPSGSVNGGGTAPDLGADEFDGVPLDLAAPIITYTAPGNTACITSRTISATITDASGVNVTAGTKPRIYFKRSVNANSLPATNDNTTDGWKYAEASNGSSPFNLLIDYSLLYGGANAADVIQYFVVAQDLVATPNVGINTGTFTVNPTSVALTSGAFPVSGMNSYTLIASLSSNVTIGAAGTYTSLTGAAGLFAAINAGGLSNNITATILDASVTETGATALNAITYGCAGSYTLTIKPAGGVTATLTGAVASGALIKLNGADNVTIDGSNSGGTDRSLTITNTSTTSPTAILLASTGTGAGATYNTIKNCNISTGVSAATGYGIAIGGSTPGVTGADNDNNTLQNNSITVATIPIWAFGTAAVSTGGMDNLTVTGNTVNSNTTITNYGIELGNAVSCSVTKNNVSVQTSFAGQPVGISLETGFVSSTVNANNITAVTTSSTGGYGGRGITVGTGTASSALTISNNFISGVNGSNWSGFTGSSSMGICIGTIGNSTTLTTTCGGVNLFYNTVNMYGNYSYATSCITAALYVGTGATVLDLRDNIFVNSMNNINASGTASKNYTVYSAAANTAYSNINYNDYYVSGTQGVLCFLGSDQTNLTNWQTATGKDANSKNISPTFTSSSDLHLVPASNVSLDNLGTYIASVLTDIDNDTRSVTTPDMGADEFTVPLGVDMGVTALVAPASYGCYSAAENVSVTIKNYSVSTIDFTVNPVTVNVTATGGYSSSAIQSSGNLTSLATMTVIMPTTINMSAPGAYTFNASTTVTGDITPGNDAMSPVTRTSSTLAGGTYTVGTTGTYTTITAAVAAFNGASCITGPIVFSLTDATYPSETYPITINANLALGSNTLTIVPASGVSPVISGASASGPVFKIMNNNTIIDGSNSGGSTRNLTIINTSVTTPSVINIASTGTTPVTNVTVKNCIITNGVNTSTAVYVTDATAGTAGYFNNITVQNNSISQAYNGLYINAVVSSGNGSGLLITGNTMTGTGPACIPSASIYVQGVDGVTVSNNTLSNNTQSAYTVNPTGVWFATGTKNGTISGNNISTLSYTGSSSYSPRGIAVSSAVTSANIVITGNTIAGLTSSGSTSVYGIYIFGATEGVSILKNKISNIKSTYASGIAAVGIGLGSSSVTANTTAANNFIWDVAAYGYSSTSNYNGYGFSIMTGGGYNLYFNSVSLATNQTIAAYPACLNISSSIVTASTLDIRDNIFSITQTTGTERYAVICNAANTVFSYIDNNDYYTLGSNLGYIGAASRANLAAWQTGTGKDVSSISADPGFMSASDLHINTSSASPVSNVGVTIAGVTDDIDGDVRTGTPDIGADEFVLTSCAGAVGGTATTSNSYCGSSTSPPIGATGYSTGLGGTYQWQYSNDNFGVDIHDFAGQTNPVALTTGAITATTYYRLKVTCSSGTATDYSTVVTITIKPVPSASASSNTPVCAGATLNFTGSSDIGTTFSWTGPNAWTSTTQNPSIASVTSAAAGTYHFTASFNGCSSVSAPGNSPVVVVNAVPSTVSISPSAPTIVAGATQQLDASGGSLSGVSLLSENFSGTPSGWTTTNLSVGGTTASAAWASQSDGYVYYSETFHSNDNSNFYMTNSDAQGASGTLTNTILTAPAVNTTGFTSLTLTFYDYFKYYTTPTNDSAVVEVSTNNSTWTRVLKYSGASRGAAGTFASESVSLTSYINQATLYVRFHFTTVYGYYWAIDNVAITGSGQSAITWSPTTNLYTDAGAGAAYSGTATPTVWAKPPSTTVYTATATSGAGCTSTANVTVTVTAGSSNWTGALSTDWNTPGNWDAGVPASSTDASIPSAASTPNQPIVNQAPGTPAVCKNLNIASGANLVINAGKAMTVSGTLINLGTPGITINSDATGTGSMIFNTAMVSGNIQRYVDAWTDDNHGWHLLSSPVSSQLIRPEFVPGSNPVGSTQDFYKWDETTGFWINSKDAGLNWVSDFETTFTTGKGYLVAYNANVTKTFSGVINVTNVPLSGLTNTVAPYVGNSTVTQGWNLIGNPFSSAFAWNSGGFNLSNIAAIAKVWTQSNASYSDVNIVTGGIVPPQQGFMVNVITDNSSGSLTIPIASRVHNSQNWYKSSGLPVIKLTAHNLSAQTAQESVVIFNDQAGTGYEPAQDSRFFAGYAPQFYSVDGAEHLSTNTLPELNSQTTVPFNFIKTAGSDYTIEASVIDNVPGEVYLTDLKLDRTQNLADNPVYTFTSSAGDNPARFVLSFSHVGIGEKTQTNNGIYTYENNLYLVNPGKARLEVFSLTGQKLLTQEVNSTGLYKTTLNVSTAFYMVRLTTGTKVVVTKVFIQS